MKFSTSMAALAASGLTLLATASPIQPQVTARVQQCKSGATFDYVVVGGGTAGLTIATRLAENPSLSVAVIEAGGFYEDSGNLSTVPAYWTLGAGTDPKDVNPLVDWGFISTPQTALNRPIHIARGKCLGGSSARNAMAYHRPTTGSFDKWAQEVGDGSYRFQPFLQWFKESVTYNQPILTYSNSTNTQDPSAFSANGGPLQLSYGKYIDPLITWAQPAIEKLGMTRLPGLQSGKLLGSAYIPFTIDPVKSERSSSESTFLQQAVQKTTLQVFRNTLVEKVLFREKQATGVLVSANGKTFTLTAKREVILSAGAIQTPQLLMVSGIGPRQTLQKFNIPVAADLQGVGQSYGDHVFFAITRAVSIPTLSGGFNIPGLLDKWRNLFNTDGSGPFSTPFGGFFAWEKLLATLRTSQLFASTRQVFDTKFTPDWPELEIIPIFANLGYNRYYPDEDPKDGKNYASVITALNAVLSTGSISISSGKMSDPPVIDPGYLREVGNREMMIAGFKRNRQLWDLLSPITVGEEKFPGPGVKTDEQILNFIQQSLKPVDHSMASCRMGKPNNKNAVVDSCARVYGVKGLRIVDASAFPFVLPGHIQATVYAFAERLAGDVLTGSGA